MHHLCYHDIFETICFDPEFATTEAMMDSHPFDRVVSLEGYRKDAYEYNEISCFSKSHDTYKVAEYYGFWNEDNENNPKLVCCSVKSVLLCNECAHYVRLCIYARAFRLG